MYIFFKCNFKDIYIFVDQCFAKIKLENIYSILMNQCDILMFYDNAKFSFRKIGTFNIIIWQCSMTNIYYDVIND